jgi:hypothetical protein
MVSKIRKEQISKMNTISHSPATAPSTSRLQERLSTLEEKLGRQQIELAELRRQSLVPVPAPAVTESTKNTSRRRLLKGLAGVLAIGAIGAAAANPAPSQARVIVDYKSDDNISRIGAMIAPAGYQHFGQPPANFRYGLVVWSGFQNIGLDDLPPTNVGIYTLGTLGLSTGSVSNNGVGLELRNGMLKVKGAGLNSKTAAYIHHATGANAFANISVLDHPALNGNPNALVFVTPRVTYNGSQNLVAGSVVVGYGDIPEIGERWYIGSMQGGSSITGYYNILCVLS